MRHRESCSPYSLSTWKLIALVLVISLPASAATYKLKGLHSFCGESECADGEHPYTGLLLGPAGALYGTTLFGGQYHGGVVFKLSADTYAESVLHNFCARSECADGGAPEADLVMDVDGNLYGTTEGGGNSNPQGGTIFKLKHSGNRWSFIVLHTFCQDGTCNDGQGPADKLSYAGQSAGAPWDGSAPLFGTTTQGGVHGAGVVYELEHSGTQWHFSVIHNFQSAYGLKALAVDPAGNVLGAVQGGGLYHGGILFKLAQGTWKESVLHNFCKSANCTDGNGPRGNLFLDAHGNLFGTTERGGANNAGAIYERKASGETSVLYSFCSEPNCTDGASPQAGVISDSAGNFFGTTISGGDFGLGTTFQLKTQKLKESVLYSFCSKSNCADGSEPNSPVILDSASRIYGTAQRGGANGNHGNVYQLNPQQTRSKERHSRTQR